MMQSDHSVVEAEYILALFWIKYTYLSAGKAIKHS